MSTSFDFGGISHKECMTLTKWSTEERWLAGEPPDEVVQNCTWYEADGTEVSDPVRVAELEMGASLIREAMEKNNGTN